MGSSEGKQRPAGGLTELIEYNRSVPLGSYFRRLAQASIAASLVAAGGCAESKLVTDAGTDDGSVVVPLKDAGPVDLPLCEGSQWQAAQGLNPALTYDYLAVYAGVCGGCPPDNFVLDSTGTLCETAVDPTACEAAVDESVALFTRHLTTTQGDVVTRYQTKEELMAFLGTVDTEQEALLVAFMEQKDVHCGDPAYSGSRAVPGGYEVIATAMTSDCAPLEMTRFVLHVATDGTVTELSAEVYESSPACVGRRPAGLMTDARVAAAGSSGNHFAEIARLEAAAVVAFHRLADELELLGAPAELVADARRAADDEVRHAETMERVARHFGSAPVAPRVEARAERSAYEVALENAVEGCVRETFGALVGTYQAMAAADPEVSLAMRTIADDETRHAALSHRVADFLDGLLDDAEREAVATARRRAVVELRMEMSHAPDPELARVAGLPAAALAVSWVDRLERDLWAV